VLSIALDLSGEDEEGAFGEANRLLGEEVRQFGGDWEKVMEKIEEKGGIACRKMIGV
jgi:hypothetical protein